MYINNGLYLDKNDETRTFSHVSKEVCDMGREIIARTVLVGDLAFSSKCICKFQCRSEQNYWINKNVFCPILQLWKIKDGFVLLVCWCNTGMTSFFFYQGVTSFTENVSSLHTTKSDIQYIIYFPVYSQIVIIEVISNNRISDTTW